MGRVTDHVWGDARGKPAIAYLFICVHAVVCAFCVFTVLTIYANRHDTRYTYLTTHARRHVLPYGQRAVRK